MGKEKAGFLTPKAIANRIKAKGLQKLRWFCQMCQKQCRDENGFKCHLTSESHQRQLLLFAENPDKYVDEFSQEFLDEFMNLLKRRFGTKRVHANVVYQEYISYREHVHMNSTQWETLTEFAKWLGREGYCNVDETEKGWFIAYIDRDPETLRRQEELAKKDKMELDDQERTNRFIAQQVERAAAASQGRATVPEYTDLQRGQHDEDNKVVFKMPGAAAAKDDKALSKPSTSSQSNALESSSQKRPIQQTNTSKSSSSSSASKKHKSALDEIMQMEEQKKEKSNRKDHWLHEGIVVKVTTKRLGDKYYKKKGVIKEVRDVYAGIIKMLDSGDKIKVDQTHLETVLPGFGKPILLVNGAYRGSEASLVSLDEKHFSCTVRITAGPLNGRLVEGVSYEDVCKLHLTS